MVDAGKKLSRSTIKPIVRVEPRLDVILYHGRVAARRTEFPLERLTTFDTLPFRRVHGCMCTRQTHRMHAVCVVWVDQVVATHPTVEIRASRDSLLVRSTDLREYVYERVAFAVDDRVPSEPDDVTFVEVEDRQLFWKVAGRRGVYFA